MTMSSELLAALVGGLFTLLVSLTVSLLQGRQSRRLLVLQLEHDDRKEAAAAKGKNIEELFIATKHWLDMIVMDDINYRKAMDGRLTYNQALDLTIKNMGDKDYDYKRIELLTAFHFPELEPYRKAFLEAQSTAHEVIVSFKKRYEAGMTTSAEASLQLGQAIEELLDRARSFEEAILQKGKQFAAGK